MELFDRTCGADFAQPVAVRFDMAALRSLARLGGLSPVLRGLVRMPARRSGGGSLARRMAGVAEEERSGVVLELVRGEVAAVLGHSSGQAVDPQRAFKDLGFDSLAAVELRNRLGSMTGLRLPATLAFDYPSTAARRGIPAGRGGWRSAPTCRCGVGREGEERASCNRGYELSLSGRS